ncbi:hypothetical protein [Bowmanella denitrificans]|uniref:hypothetical protein n=1 Tax=Bowmanella denitrificans TaxID=366582 RepID=UPI000C9AD2F2|nr:hypothetical protein [Bowmanella denitrificans]
MNLETIAGIATIVSCALAYLTYRIQRGRSDLEQKEMIQDNKSKKIYTEEKVSIFESSGRDKSNLFKTHSLRKVQEFSVAKIPFFAKNKFEKLVSVFINTEKNNSGLYRWQGYGVNVVQCVFDKVFTSCDCHLAVNVWSKDYGRAIKRLVGDAEQSYTTVFLRVSSDGHHIVFGNGKALYYSQNLSSPIKIEISEFDFESAFFSGKDSFCFIHNNAGSVFLSEVCFKQMPSPKINPILDVSEIYRDASGISVDQMCNWNDMELLCVYRKSPWYTPKEFSKLIIYDKRAKEIVCKHEIYGFQDLQIDHSNKKIYVLSDKISVYNDQFKVVGNFELEKRWSQTGSWSLGAIAARPCGEIIAYSIFKDGEIILCDSSDFKLIRKIKSIGIYNFYLKWSPSGRYLAYLSYDEDSRDYLYTVYDYNRDEDVYRQVTYCPSRGKPILEWSNERYQDELMVLKDSSLLEWIRFR